MHKCIHIFQNVCELLFHSRESNVASVSSVLYLTCSGVSVTWQHVHYGALSCSVWTQQSKNLTWGKHMYESFLQDWNRLVQWCKNETCLFEHRKRCSLWPLSLSCSGKNLRFRHCAPSSGCSPPLPVSEQTTEQSSALHFCSMGIS